MKDLVKITDDTHVLNECYEVPAFVRDDHTGFLPCPNPYYVKLDQQTKINPVTGIGELYGAPNFGKTVFFPMKRKNKQRNLAQVQTVVPQTLVIKGRQLEVMLARAKRYIRSKGFLQSKRPARHIGVAMAAFLDADPDGFKAAMAARA